MLSARPTNLTSDTPYFPTRTPGRGLKNNRAENAHVGLSMTATRKGKEAGPPKTPFQSGAGHRMIKDQKSILMTTSRVLGDKTPLPNRLGALLLQTPAAQKQGQKPSKLAFTELNVNNDTIDEGNTPPSSHRPSSMRRHSKLGRKSNAFQTPANQGNHWDVSDGDIVVEAEAVVQEVAEVVDEGNDSVEYAPPNTLDLPFCPPIDFDLPDYKQLGRSICEVAFSTPCWDIQPPVIEDITTFETADYRISKDSPSSYEQSDDPFVLAQRELEAERKPSKPNPIPPTTKPTTTRNGEPKVRPRPQSAFAKPIAKPLPTGTRSGTAQPTSKFVRPATAASVYPASRAKATGSSSSSSVVPPQRQTTIRTVIKPAPGSSSSLRKPAVPSSLGSRVGVSGPTATSSRAASTMAVRRPPSSSLVPKSSTLRSQPLPPPRRAAQTSEAPEVRDVELDLVVSHPIEVDDFVFDA